MTPEVFGDLLAEIQALCQAGIAKGDEAGRSLAVLERELAALKPGRGSGPFAPSQVETQLPQALAQAEGMPAEGLATALAACLPQLGWWDMRELYGAYPEHETFVANYAFTLVAGGSFKGQPCPFTSKTIYLGFSLQGPNTLYPGHYHKAVEIYSPVSGQARWFRDRDGWRTRTPGEIFHHEADENHAMQSGGEPLLALFAWISDLDSDVFLTAG